MAITCKAIQVILQTLAYIPLPPAQLPFFVWTPDPSRRTNSSATALKEVGPVANSSKLNGFCGTLIFGIWVNE